MEVLLAILATIPLSYAIDLLSLSDLVKKAADEGYIPNLEAFKKGKENDEDNFINKYKRYIPIVCLVNSLNDALDTLLNKHDKFEEMRINGYFETMTKEEEEYYNKKKTALSVYSLASIRNKNNEMEMRKCIKSNIKYIDNSLDDHEIILKDEEKEEKIDLDEYLFNLSKEELEELKNDIKVVKDWKSYFDDSSEGDYTLKEEKGKKLIYRFNCKDSDKNQNRINI